MTRGKGPKGEFAERETIACLCAYVVVYAASRRGDDVDVKLGSEENENARCPSRLKTSSAVDEVEASRRSREKRRRVDLRVARLGLAFARGPRADPIARGAGSPCVGSIVPSWR